MGFTTVSVSLITLAISSGQQRQLSLQKDAKQLSKVLTLNHPRMPCFFVELEKRNLADFLASVYIPSIT